MGSKYRVQGTKIEKLEVVKETEKQIVYKFNNHEYRQAKTSSYQMWFCDFDSAKLYLIDKHERMVESAKRSLESKTKDLQTVYNLSE